jgi:hypothetical protein
MAEFVVNGHTYKNTKWKLFDAIDWLKDIGPLFVANETGGGAAAIALALREMPKEMLHMAVSSCLGSCERKMPSGKGWAKVWNEEAQQPMFDDLNDIGDASKVCWAVMQDNYASFLKGKG